MFKLRKKNFCTAGKAFAVKALRRMNGDSIFYNLFGSGVSCLRIKRLRDLKIEFLIRKILPTFMWIDGAKRLLNFRHFKL